uniref:Uncharacterized protein n=1 Tax=Vespula pensylvanica TaxID=30213 RepID=A0A834NYL9_VESPE|nr:hypothetical protein H0235_009507 [Vespula pensylvanica]
MPRGTNGEIEEKLQINGRERNEQEDCRWSAGFMKQSPEISKGYALAIPPVPPFQVETPGTGASIAAGTTIAAVAAVAAGAAAAAAPGHANTNFRTPRRRTKSTYGIVELGENINSNVKDQEKHGPTKVTFIYRDVCLFFCELWYYPTNVETDVQTANVAESAFTILSVRSDDGSL